MKTIINNHRRLITSLAVFCAIGLLLPGCDKVDRYYEDVAERPQVDTRVTIIIPEGERFANSGYKRMYTIGDTATWVGRFFLDAGTPVIRVGDADAEIVHHEKLPVAGAATNAHLNEIVRFVITEEMGIGANRPVSITANGTTTTALYLTINQFVGLEGRTDTTLVVDKLVTWEPENPSDYFLPEEERASPWDPGQLTWINNASVTVNNVIYFDNARGVFRVNPDGSVESWLSFGQELTENGQSFNLSYTICSAVDDQHAAVYVSARVSEDGPDAETNYIFRLMKIDPLTKAVTTLNRTLIPKESGSPVTANPVQGTVDQVPIVATRMTWGTSGLYFANAAPARPVGNVLGYLSALYINKPGALESISTLCQLGPDGQTLRVLMRSGGNASTGLKVGDVYQYRLKPDGQLLYTIPDNVPAFGFGILYYDIALGQAIFTKTSTQHDASLLFTSFDQNPETRYIQPSPMSFRTIVLGDNDTDNPFNWTVSAAGEIVSFRSMQPSLFAVKVDAYRMYCYAGTELGLFQRMDGVCINPVPGQDQETGPSKQVKFVEQYCDYFYDNTIDPRFIESDPQGAIFFYKFSKPNFPDYQQLYSPVRFYKLYPKR